MEVFGSVVFLFITVIIVVFACAIIKGKQQGEANIAAAEEVEDILRKRGFSIDKTVGTLGAKLFVDNTNKQWAVKELGESTDVKIYNYKDLIDFELLEDGESKIKGGFGKSLIGGALGGTKGAIIGSAASRKIKETVSLLEIVIRTNDFSKPQYNISFIKGYSLPKDANYRRLYDMAQEVIGVLNYISSNGEEKSNTAENNKPNVSNADKLKKYKDLLDSGVITQEEFDAKKKQLLGL